jgi:hypothetical protein
MADQQLVLSLKPEQFKEIQRLAKESGAKSIGLFVRGIILEYLDSLDDDDSKAKTSSKAAPKASSKKTNTDINSIFEEIEKALDSSKQSEEQLYEILESIESIYSEVQTYAYESISSELNLESLVGSNQQVDSQIRSGETPQTPRKEQLEPSKEYTADHLDNEQEDQPPDMQQVLQKVQENIQTFNEGTLSSYIHQSVEQINAAISGKSSSINTSNRDPLLDLMQNTKSMTPPSKGQYTKSYSEEDDEDMISVPISSATAGAKKSKSTTPRFELSQNADESAQSAWTNSSGIDSDDSEAASKGTNLPPPRKPKKSQ